MKDEIKQLPPIYKFFLTWEEAQMIIDMFDDHESDIARKLSEQLLFYAEVTDKVLESWKNIDEEKYGIDVYDY